MADPGKILVGVISAGAGFLAVSLWAPFGKGSFDYASAPLEEKQKYLESKARNMTRGFKLTAGNSSEISSTYVDAETDLISLTITLNKSGAIPTSELSTARSLLMKTACSLTERKLLTQTDFKLRIRYFQSNGANLMTVEASGENCAPYLY